MKQVWEREARVASRRSKRSNIEEVVFHKPDIREKKQELEILETAEPSEFLAGARDWYMSLRQSALDSSVRHVHEPLGNPMHSGLYVSMEKNTKTHFQIVKRPFTPMKKESFYRQTASYKKKVARN